MWRKKLELFWEKLLFESITLLIIFFCGHLFSLFTFKQHYKSMHLVLSSGRTILLTIACLADAIELKVFVVADESDNVIVLLCKSMSKQPINYRWKLMIAICHTAIKVLKVAIKKISNWFSPFAKWWLKNFLLIAKWNAAFSCKYAALLWLNLNSKLINSFPYQMQTDLNKLAAFSIYRHFTMCLLISLTIFSRNTVLFNKIHQDSSLSSFQAIYSFILTLLKIDLQ